MCIFWPTWRQELKKYAFNLDTHACTLYMHNTLQKASLNAKRITHNRSETFASLKGLETYRHISSHIPAIYSYSMY